MFEGIVFTNRLNWRYLVFLFVFFFCLAVVARTTATELSTPARTDIVRYLNYLGIAGDGMDEIFDDTLSQMSRRHGVVWWEVFGTLLTAETVLSDLNNGNYEGALSKLAKHTAFELIKTSSGGDALSGAYSIASLAALPIDLSLHAWADLVSNHGFQYQVEAYNAARSEFLMSHDEIIQQSRPDPTITYDNFGYLRTVGEHTPHWYRPSRPDRRISREATYKLIWASYEAPALMELVKRERSTAINEFKLILLEDERSYTDISGSWLGFAKAGSTLIDYKWSIEQDDNDIAGNISLKLPDHDDWKTYIFKGHLSGSKLKFAGTNWITSNNGSFCLAAGTLELAYETDNKELSGTWGSNPAQGGCAKGAGGTVRLTKQ